MSTQSVYYIHEGVCLMKEDQKRLESLIMEKKSLPDCERKRVLERVINEMKSKTKTVQDKPDILVRYAGKTVGILDFNEKESSWLYKSNDGSTIEVGFKYEDARTWASMNGFQLKVVQNA